MKWLSILDLILWCIPSTTKIIEVICSCLYDCLHKVIPAECPLPLRDKYLWTPAHHSLGTSS